MKMMAEKELIINSVKCEYVKAEESMEFICTRCKQRKISKKYAEYVEGKTKRLICNACYGNLLSKL